MTALNCELCGQVERERSHSLCLSCGELIVRLLRYPPVAVTSPAPQLATETPSTSRFGRIRPGLLCLRELNSTPEHIENENLPF